MKKVTSKAKEPVKLRVRQLTNGNRSLLLDYMVNGERIRETLKEYLIPEKTPEDKIQNKETLRRANKRKSELIIDLMNNAKGLTNSRRLKVNFIQYLNNLVEVYTRAGSSAYARTLKNTIIMLEKYKGNSITLQQVDKAYLLGFINFLNTPCGKYGGTLSNSTKDTYFTAVTNSLNKAVRDDIIPFNPATKIHSSDKPKAGESIRPHLTVEEVRKLAATPCKYDVIKQAFMFSCNCGLRMSDVKQLKWQDLHKAETNSNGIKYQLELIQQKTRGALYIPITENACEWLPRVERPLDDDYIFQLPHVSTIEKFLDRWAKDAGLKKHVTFHVSRHTAASIMIANNVPTAVIQKILGHKKIETTQIYAKTNDKQIIDAISNMPKFT